MNKIKPTNLKKKILLLSTVLGLSLVQTVPFHALAAEGEGTLTGYFDDTGWNTAYEDTVIKVKKWKMTPKSENAVSVDYYFEFTEEPAKFELFYTKGAETPKITVKKGKNAVTTKDSESGNGIQLLTRVNKTVTGEDGLSMMAVYVTNGSTDTQNYELTVTFPAGVREALLVQAQVPDNYRMLTKEYKTVPISYLCYGTSEDSFFDFSTLTLAAQPEEYTSEWMSTIETPEEVRDYTSLIMFITFFVLIGMAFFVFRTLTKRKNEKIDAEEKRNARVQEKTKKASAIKEKKEDRELDRLIQRYNYDDDEDDEDEIIGVDRREDEDAAIMAARQKTMAKGNAATAKASVEDLDGRQEKELYNATPVQEKVSGEMPAWLDESDEPASSQPSAQEENMPAFAKVTPAFAADVPKFAEPIPAFARGVEKSGWDIPAFARTEDTDVDNMSW